MRLFGWVFGLLFDFAFCLGWRPYVWSCSWCLVSVSVLVLVWCGVCRVDLISLRVNLGCSISAWGPYGFVSDVRLTSRISFVYNFKLPCACPCSFTLAAGVCGFHRTLRHKISAMAAETPKYSDTNIICLQFFFQIILKLIWAETWVLTDWNLSLKIWQDLVNWPPNPSKFEVEKVDF